RLVIHAQRYTSRSRAGSRRETETAIARMSCVQLVCVSTVERSHRIALASRVGAYPRDTVSRLIASGRIFEYWAHEACLLPIDDWPLFAAAMRSGGRRWSGPISETHPHLADEILEEIRDRGPLGSRHFEGAARKNEMWG